MKLSFDDNGLVVDGVECQISDRISREIVFDLNMWIRSQYMRLVDEGKTGYHCIRLGDGDDYFVSICVNRGKYWVRWALEESAKRAWCKGLEHYSTNGTTELNELCDEIVLQAALVSDFSWIDESGKNRRYFAERVKRPSN